MNPVLHRFGEGRHPVVVIDNFTGKVDAIVEIAAELAPFPPDEISFYPGLRRFITKDDQGALAYALGLLHKAGPFIVGAFDFETFNLFEASFSMVTTPPEALSLPQRAPHFDTTDPNELAVLHYLSDTPGTAFYRQRLTGIEQVDQANRDQFVVNARAIAIDSPGYIHQSDAHYEQIGRVEGVADRLIIYRGSLLHSGIIPPDARLSDDPRRGRLTANLFVLGQR